jgi:hypothetical protein
MTREEATKPEDRTRQIEDRIKAAHPGPWGVKEYGSAGSEYINVNGPSPFKVFDCPESILTMQWPCHSAEELTQAEKLTEATAEFIAHAREDIPWLLEQLHRRTPSLSEPSQTEAAREAVIAASLEKRAAYKVAASMNEQTYTVEASKRRIEAERVWTKAVDALAALAPSAGKQAEPEGPKP